MATVSHTVGSHQSLFMFPSAKATATEIHCKHNPPQTLLFFSETHYSAKRQMQTIVSCQPALSTAGMEHGTDSQPQRAEQQNHSVSMIELLSLPLNCSLCTAALQEAGCMEPINAQVFPALYHHLISTCQEPHC